MTLRLLIGALASLATLGLPAVEPEDVIVRMLSEQGVVLEIDGKQRVLDVGEKSPEGIRVIDANSTTVTLEIDGERRSFGIEGALPSESPQRDEEPVAAAGEPGGSKTALAADVRPSVVVKLQPRTGRYMTDGAINGRPVSFIIDTGATMVTLSRSTARELGIDYLSGQRATSTTVAGDVEVYTTTLEEVRVGDIVREDVPVAVVNDDSLTHVLLGMSFLASVDMTQRAGELELADQDGDPPVQ